ncbi:MAG: hypothetical protein OXI60_11865 [Acidiferrobacterales bacterium]|nr:hypothetical protein [Acidiferrobacterales bacterium]
MNYCIVIHLDGAWMNKLVRQVPGGDGSIGVELLARRAATGAVDLKNGVQIAANVTVNSKSMSI